MATTKKKTTKTAPPPPTSAPPAGTINRKRQLRLGFGIFFLLSGIFLCFSIVSYFFTWKEDQDVLLSSGNMSHFIFQGDEAVTNWGGRMGAAASHALVYNGAGIAALAIGIWITL